MVQDQGETTFLGALTDFTFDSFVSVKLIRILYILALVVGVFITVVGVVIAFTNGIMSGIFGIIFAPLFFLVFAVIVRVWLELMIVAFRIADHVKEIADNTRTQN